MLLKGLRQGTFFFQLEWEGGWAHCLKAHSCSLYMNDMIYTALLTKKNPAIIIAKVMYFVPRPFSSIPIVRLF